MSIRDEAHRFAQAYHHVLRRKKTLGQEEPVRKGRSRKRKDGQAEEVPPEDLPPDVPPEE
jgi:hypothetical protein